MSKKIISLLLACCILCCLSACGTTETSNSANNTPSESQTDDTTQHTDEAIPTEAKGSESSASSNVENSEENNTVQAKPIPNQTKPTSTVNQPSHTHSYSNATCTSPKKCYCGATAGKALGHRFSSATCTNSKTCSRCGTTSGSSLGHNYVNNKCSRCGKTDPDSLPVGLNKLFLIDSYRYQYKSGSFKDSFGNSYDGVHYFTDLYESLNGKEPYAIFNLNGKYKLFTGSIVASTTTNPNWTYYINIYVDGVLKFSKTGFSKTSGKVDFKINVTNGEILKIMVGTEHHIGDVDEEIGIVNAKLTK